LRACTYRLQQQQQHPRGRAGDRSLQTRGMSLIELLIAMTIFGLILAGCFQLFRNFSGRNAVRLTARLELQLEVRRAMVNLYREIQEGIEIFKPDPGATLPFLMLRDYLNNLHLLYLEKDLAATKREGCDMFRLYSVTYDVGTQASSAPREVLANITSMNFTSHGFAGVLITGYLRREQASFSFVNMIRLKNATAGDT